MTHYAIDPDINESGVATYTDGETTITLSREKFPRLLSEIVDKSKTDKVEVMVEAGWENHSYFHLSPTDSKAVTARKGYNVGENHRVGKMIVEYLTYNGIDVNEVKPLRKVWIGNGGKISHEELERQAKRVGLTLSKGRSNQDERDAALIGLVSWKLSR